MGRTGGGLSANSPGSPIRWIQKNPLGTALVPMIAVVIQGYTLEVEIPPFIACLPMKSGDFYLPG